MRLSIGAELRDRHDRRVRGESVPSHFEYEEIRVDGNRMWLEVEVVPITDSEGKFVGTQSAISDIRNASGRNRPCTIARDVCGI